MEITEKKGVDIVVDATGLSESIETAIKIAGKYGQVILDGLSANRLYNECYKFL